MGNYTENQLATCGPLARPRPLFLIKLHGNPEQVPLLNTADVLFYDAHPSGPGWKPAIVCSSESSPLVLSRRVANIIIINQ